MLTAVAFAALAGTTPDIKDSGATIAAFYDAHSQKQEVAAYVLMIGVGFLALFVASCWPLIRDPHRLWSALFFAGGIIAAASFLFAGAVHLALADGAHHGVDPVALQALNALDADSYLAFGPAVGIMLLGGAGAMIPLSGALRVLGWIALLLGIATFTPAGFIGFVGAGVWVIAVSLVLFMRGDGAVPTAATPSVAV